MDPVILKIIDDLIIEKMISRYIPRVSDYVKQEAYLHCLLCILESKYKEAKSPLNYCITIIINLIHSKNSTFYKLYRKDDYKLVNIDKMNI